MFGLPLIPIVLLAAGVFDLLIALGFHLFLERLKKRADILRRKWRPVTAKILSSRVVESAGEDATLFTAEVRYQYTVDGIRRECDRISIYPRWSSSNSGEHDKVVRDYPAGSERQAWVNPWKPEEAVLLTNVLPPLRPRLIFLILIGTGVTTLLAGALTWAFGGGARD